MSLSLSSLPTRGVGTRRHPQSIWPVELGPWTRSMDAQTLRPKPHSFHHCIFPPILPVGAARCDQKFLIFPLLSAHPSLARVTPLCRLPEAEQPRQEEGGGRGKAIWLLFQLRIHRKVRICIAVQSSLIFCLCDSWIGRVPTGLRPRMADLTIGNTGAILRPRAAPVFAVVIFGDPRMFGLYRS